MKNILYIIILLIIFSCDTENVSDCLKTSGTTVTKNYSLEEFSKVIFHEGIELEIKQGPINGLRISYGENLIDEIHNEIIGDQLIITNNTSCKLIRDFEPAKVTLTASDISEIRNASQFKVFSTEFLRFHTITLISENYLVDYVNVGDFDLMVKNQNINIISNNVSNFVIKGNTTNLFVGFYSGQGRFDGELLTANNIAVFHRGINKMVVNPTLEITGEIRGAGNVLSINRPPIVNVEEFYTGKLIFRN